MGKCIVCGKKGLFFRVNSFGRCKECEEKIQNEERKQAEIIRKQQEEAERKRREEAEERRKEEEEKKETAKERLKNMIIVYNEIDGHIFTIKEDEDCEEFIPEIMQHIQKYKEFNCLLEEAKKDEIFLDVLMEFICSTGDYFSDLECSDIKYGLYNKYYIIKDIYKTKEELVDGIVLSWWSLAYEIKEDWEKTKNSIEKAVARKKKREAKLQKESVVNIKAEDNILYPNNGKDISHIQKESFEIVPDCVITDIETSGLIYNKNSIIEIAAIKIIDGKVTGTYSSLVHRDKPLDSKIITLTGITTQMLRECKKSLEEVITEYRDFVCDFPLVGHNIKSFDIRFINEAYMTVFNQPISNDCIDTLLLAREQIKDSEDYKLQTLAQYLKLPVSGAHRALADCETTMRLYEHLNKCAKSSKQVVSDAKIKKEVVPYELNETDEWIINMTRKVFEGKEHSYFRYARHKQHLVAQCAGKLFKIKTTGKLKNYFEFEPEYEEIALTQTKLRIEPSSKKNENSVKRIFFETEDDFLSMASVILEIYKLKKNEIEKDIEAEKNFDNTGFIRIEGYTAHYERWVKNYLEDPKLIKL